MRIRATNGNDIFITPRPRHRWAIEQGQSHILLNERELDALIAALRECANDFNPAPRIQRFVGGVEQF